MNVNATFFIQLIHFFIGYIILERLFIRPWIGSMAAELKQKKEVEALLQEAQKRVNLKEKFKEEQWREFQVSFAQAIPLVSLEFQRQSLHPQQSPQSAQAEAKALDTHKIIHFLVSRLTHE